MFLNETLKVKVPITCNKLLNITDKTVLYQFRECVLKTVLIIFSKKDHTEEFMTFIIIEKYRPGVMTSARIQLFCKIYNLNIGYFNGKEIWPRTITQTNIALKIHNKDFCLIWTSNGISFNQVIEDDIKPNFKTVDNILSGEHVKSFIKYDNKPKKSPIPFN